MKGTYTQSRSNEVYLTLRVRVRGLQVSGLYTNFDPAKIEDQHAHTGDEYGPNGENYHRKRGEAAALSYLHIQAVIVQVYADGSD